MTVQRMTGTRELVVEDEFLLAIALEEILAEEGCVIVGPFARVAPALVAAGTDHIDLAILDVNVAGEMVFPVAHLLESRSIPFVLLTGYGHKVIPLDSPHWQAYEKPYVAETLVDALVEKLSIRRKE